MLEDPATFFLNLVCFKVESMGTFFLPTLSLSEFWMFLSCELFQLNYGHPLMRLRLQRKLWKSKININVKSYVYCQIGGKKKKPVKYHFLNIYVADYIADYSAK